jgi:hypothetical protein
MVQFQDSVSKLLHHIPFLTCSLANYLKPIVPEFYHVLAKGQTFNLLLNQFCRNPTLKECEDDTHTLEMGT